MSTLVERLRARRVSGMWPDSLVEDPDCAEAASTIEALRDQLQQFDVAAEMVLDWWHEWLDADASPEEIVAFEALETARAALSTHPHTMKEDDNG